MPECPRPRKRMDCGRGNCYRTFARPIVPSAVPPMRKLITRLAYLLPAAVLVFLAGAAPGDDAKSPPATGAASTRPADGHFIHLNARSRKEIEPKSGRFDMTENPVEWDARETAVIICDLWDKHWCEGATKRVGEMAPRINDFVSAVRAKGGLIVHAPSDTMKNYEGTPGRKLAGRAAGQGGRRLQVELPRPGLRIAPADRRQGRRVRRRAADARTTAPGRASTRPSRSLTATPSATRGRRFTTYSSRRGSRMFSTSASTPTCASSAGRSASGRCRGSASTLPSSAT